MSSYLAFPPLPIRARFAILLIDIALANSRRYISVALVLKSPSAGVTRYPCPAEPGLSSRKAVGLLRAAVQPTCLDYFNGREKKSQSIGVDIQLMFSINQKSADFAKTALDAVFALNANYALFEYEEMIDGD